MSELASDQTPPTTYTAWAETAQRGVERAAERIVALDSPLYAGLPGHAATGSAPAVVEDGPAPAGHQVDVLESAEGRVIPSLLTRVTHARGDAVIAQRSALRIAIYSQDGLGLGHLRRTTLIGRRLLEAAPDSAVLLFADSPVGPIFALPPGMDCVKLPSILKINAGEWRPTSLPIPTTDLQRLRSELLSRTLVEYQPDLVLVDHMPGGVQGELRPALGALRQERPACRIVLGLRDVLDAPHVTRRVWQDEGAYEALRRRYDAVLIYGHRELFDTAAAYHIPAPPGGLHYVCHADGARGQCAPRCAPGVAA